MTRSRKGRILSVASECAPLVKTGGLADVAGALPGALTAEGWQVQTLLPAYPGLMPLLEGAKVIWSDPAFFGGPARGVQGRAGGLDVVLLDAPHLYDRPGGPYAAGGADHADNPERFAALSLAAAEIARIGGADILHAHDWQAGLAPYYLKRQAAQARPIRSVLTIHNVAFQGIAPADRLASLRLDRQDFTPEILEYWGNISTLKAGLVMADGLTTVSPTYADELMRPEFGLGLEGVIARCADAMHGILNGIDDAVWNPETDPHVLPYTATRPGAKARNRARLLAEFGLQDMPGPLAVLVSRLTHQKGIDLLAPAIDPFIAAGGGLAILGSGDPALEADLASLAARHPGHVGLKLGYDEALSHRMFAGGDAVLVPSRFEPCGLTQMYGLRYGAVPVVAATGGLNDTVINATPAALSARAATGITFHPVDPLGLAQALRRLTVLHADKAIWQAMRKRGMSTDLGWSQSAHAYSALYERLLSQ